MDRWDFDCQECGRNIGDPCYVDPVWYMCSQNAKEYGLLRSVYPRTLYLIKGKDIFLSDQTIPQNVANEITKRIREYSKERLRDKDPLEAWTIHSGNLKVEINFESSEVIWSLEDREDEYYQKAGIKKHIVKGRGRGRLGYTFDEKCAENLGYKCNLCGSELVKVTADQHPGGQWGIRGTLGAPVREPAPMRHASIRLKFEK